MRLLVFSALALAAFLVILPLTAAAQPEPVFIFPEDGEVFSEPPPIFRLCFDKAVNIKDLDNGGDFAFKVITPQQHLLGARIVFRPDGMGVDVYRGIPLEPTEGEWTFQWRVTDAKTVEPKEGTLHFTVQSDGGSPVPEELPKTCDEAATPVATETPSTSAGDGDGTDTTILVIVIVAAAAGIGAAGFVVYRLVHRRKRPPRPQTRRR